MNAPTIKTSKINNTKMIAGPSPFSQQLFINHSSFICGKTIPTLSNGEEAVVTFENGDKISVNDLYKEIKDNYALQTLLQMIDKKILEAEFPDEVKSKREKWKILWSDDSIIKSYTI